MDIVEDKVDGKVVVSISGHIDSTTAVPFEQNVIAIINRGVHTLIVDLSNVPFVSSAGLRVLLLAAKKVKPFGGKILLAGLSSDVREVFDISGFSSMFSIFDNVSDAAKG